MSSTQEIEETATWGGDAGDSSAAEESWQALTDATTDSEACAAWLAILRRRTGAEVAIALLGPEDSGPYRPAARSPESAEVDAGSGAAADLAIAQRQPIVKSGLPRLGSDGPAGCAVACPIMKEDRLAGAIVLRLRVTADLDLRAVMREMQWAMPWLTLRLVQRDAAGHRASGERSITALKLLASALDEERFRVACSTVVTELADRLECDRVSIGFRRRFSTRVESLSHSAGFSRKVQLTRLIADAMDEAIDQRSFIQHPAQGDDPLLLTAGHAALSELGSKRCLATAPLTVGERYIGAVTFERPSDRPFDVETVELIEVVASILGPLLEEKRLNDRWLATKAGASAARATGTVLGPRHLGKKLIVLAAVGVLVALWQTEADFHVAADARVEGSVRRVIAAPLDGYVESAAVRAGDTVEKGAVMARLDDREIALELERWRTRKAQREREYERALSQEDRAEAGIITSRIRQAEAEISLLEERLARMRLTAPFDGLVLSGDLDQSIGGAVERGEVLFEVAPLEAYRVVVSVPERDVALVEPGQQGSLVLASLPDRSFPIGIGRITSVATVEEGENVFRAEAEVRGQAGALRPGMEGIAKVRIGERPLLEIWTRRTVDWLRLTFWRFLP